MCVWDCVCVHLCAYVLLCMCVGGGGAYVIVVYEYGCVEKVLFQSQMQFSFHTFNIMLIVHILLIIMINFSMKRIHPPPWPYSVIIV